MTGLENVENNADPSGLSAEQADTDRLLRRLLGTAIADRYGDFCRLASGRLPLAVSRPLAGHAMRELDSLIRHVLAVPMDARAVDDPEQTKQRADARKALIEMGFDEAAAQRAEAALKPRLSHKHKLENLSRGLGSLQMATWRRSGSNLITPMDVPMNVHSTSVWKWTRRFASNTRGASIRLFAPWLCS